MRSVSGEDGCPEVQNLRVRVLKPLRLEHGYRLKEDNVSSSAIDLALKHRIQWAKGDWLSCCRDMVDILHTPGVLVDLGIAPDPSSLISNSRAIAPVSAGPRSELLTEILESLVRVAFGLQARAYSLWSGGVYKLVLLLDPHERSFVAARASNIFRNCLLLEQYLQTPSGNEHPVAGASSLEQSFIWKDHTVWRELHGMLLQGQFEAAVAFSSSIHSTVLHEKGTTSLARAREFR